MWRYSIPALMIIILGAFLARGLFMNPAHIESPLVGKPAPEFSLPNVTNRSERVGTADMVGKFSLLNVWATWCVECRHEHDFLLELAQSGVPIYGLNYKEEARQAPLDWLRVLGDPYVASASDEIGDVAIDYGVYGAPETFLLDPDLTILHKHIGPLNAAIWERDFVPLIEAHRQAREGT